MYVKACAVLVRLRTCADWPCSIRTVLKYIWAIELGDFIWRTS